MSLILSIDQGTTGSTALIIDRKSLKLLAKANYEYPQIYPKNSWVEHDLNDIWHSIEKAVESAIELAKCDKNNISLIGITNQRETTTAFSNSGKPLHNAIVWQDRRTESYCLNLSTKGHTETIRKKTGLPIDAYFSGSKINWLLNNSSEVKIHANKNDIKFGTIDTFLLYKLTSGKSYFTDTTNASRTMLMNLTSGNWDDELLGLFGINKNQLPEIKESFSNFGTTNNLNFLPDGIPITCILGDQQAALFGQNCIHEGQSKCTYGTGAFMLLNTGNKLIYSDHGLLTTVAYSHKNKIHYALEGSTYIAGAAVQWLRDALGFFPKSAEIENMARKASLELDKNESLLFLPFFTGLGSPYWVSNAKAAILGLTRDTSKTNLSLACLEGIALSINDLILAFQQDFKNKVTELKVDGGACSNDLLMELQATVSELNIIVPEIIETTGYGAALGAVVGNGDIEIEGLKHTWNKSKTITPQDHFKKYLKAKNDLWNAYIKKLYL